MAGYRTPGTNREGRQMESDRQTDRETVEVYIGTLAGLEKCNKLIEEGWTVDFTGNPKRRELHITLHRINRTNAVDK